MTNIGLKAISVALAIVVWFTVSAPRREQVIERTFPAGLSLVGMPRGFVITTPLPDDINVRLRARKSHLDSLSSRNLEALMDLNWVQKEGSATITVGPQSLNIPPEVEVVSIEPNRIQLRVEALRQRSVAIRPFLIGEVPRGFVAGDPRADPDRALVSGPASQILAMTEVGTERIIMTGRTATFVQNAVVVSDTPMVRVLSPLTTQVTVPVLAEIGPNPPPPTDTAGEEGTPTP